MNSATEPLATWVTNHKLVAICAVIVAFIWAAVALNRTESPATVTTLVAQPSTPPTHTAAAIVQPPPTPAEQKRLEAEAERKLEAERIDYAQTLEDGLLLTGFNVDVTTSGLHHTHLTLTYVLVDKSFVRRFEIQDANKLAEMRVRGFTRFTMANGFGERWYWDLHY